MVGRRCKNSFSINSTVSAPIETEDTQRIIKIQKRATGIIEATTACRPDNLEGSLSF